MPGHGGIRTYDLWNSNRPDRVAQLAEHWASGGHIPEPSTQADRAGHTES